MPISGTYNMDCMDYMKSMPDKFFDLAVVDPPYGISWADKKWVFRNCELKNFEPRKGFRNKEYFRK